MIVCCLTGSLVYVLRLFVIHVMKVDTLLKRAGLRRAAQSEPTVRKSDV